MQKLFDWFQKLPDHPNKFVSNVVGPSIAPFIIVGFVIYLTMGQPEDKVWNGLFWVTLLFICVNAVARSFLQESKGRLLYYYTMIHPVEFIFAKLIY